MNIRCPIMTLVTDHGKFKENDEKGFFFSSEHIYLIFKAFVFENHD